jgi:hypothetical protein
VCERERLIMHSTHMHHTGTHTHTHAHTRTHTQARTHARTHLDFEDDKEHAVSCGVHGVALLVHRAPQDDAQDTEGDEDDRACRTWRETREEGNTSEPACIH